MSTVRFVATPVLALIALTMGACSSGSNNLAIVSSSPASIGIGEQRVLLAEVDPETTSFVGGPGETVTVDFTGPSGDSQTAPAEWVWSIEGVRGFLVAHPTFDEAGTWTAAIASPRGTTAATAFTVANDITMPEVGEPALRSETRTSATFDLEAITTDPDPVPAFYELTVAEAVENGVPSIIVFATPAFCQTATCGPTMDIVKAASVIRPDVDVVHVEVFENVESDGAGALIEVPAVREWGLPSEPWVFVIDGTGIVSARFEGALSVDELVAAIDEAGQAEG